MMLYYFLIKPSEITRPMINCSTSHSLDDMPIIWIPGMIFKTEYRVLKVEESIFNTVTYFDSFQAYSKNEMRALVEKYTTNIDT